MEGAPQDDRYMQYTYFPIYNTCLSEVMPSLMASFLDAMSISFPIPDTPMLATNVTNKDESRAMCYPCKPQNRMEDLACPFSDSALEVLWECRPVTLVPFTGLPIQ